MIVPLGSLLGVLSRAHLHGYCYKLGVDFCGCPTTRAVLFWIYIMGSSQTESPRPEACCAGLNNSQYVGRMFLVAIAVVSDTQNVPENVARVLSWVLNKEGSKGEAYRRHLGKPREVVGNTRLKLLTSLDPTPSQGFRVQTCLRSLELNMSQGFSMVSQHDYAFLRE